MQLLLDALTETERQLFIKMAGDLAEDFYKIQQLDVKEYFQLQNPQFKQISRIEKVGKLSGMDCKEGGKGHSQNYKLVSIV